MAADNDQPNLLDALKDFRFTPNPDRKAGGYYSRDGDSWFLILEDVPYKRVRVDSIFTAFEALDTGKLVGLQIKGVSALMADLTKLGCLVAQDNAVQVVALLMESFKLEATAVSPVFRLKMYTKAVRNVPEEAMVPTVVGAGSTK